MSGMRGIILSLHGGVLKVISQEKDDEEDPEYIVKDKEGAVSYTHLRAHETGRNLVCRLLLEKKK